MKSIRNTLCQVAVITLVLAVSAVASQGYGTLSGVVLDPSGTPQMGATVRLISEDLSGRTVSHSCFPTSTALSSPINSSRANTR